MKTRITGRQYLRGMDISEYQDKVAPIDWTKVALAGMAFCIIRASHGLQADTMFASHRAGAKSIHLPAGFYHYLNPVVSIDDQVKNFVQVVGSLQPGDLLPVVDVEGVDAWAPVARGNRLGLILQWLRGVEKGLGVKPIVYCSLNFIKQVLADPAVDVSQLGHYLLWIAEYGLQPGVTPTLPSPWTVWTFWQFAANTSVAGISGDVDGDWFNGTLTDLQKLMVPAAATAANEAGTSTKTCTRARWPDKRRTKKNAQRSGKQ